MAASTKQSIPGPSAWENHKWGPWPDQIPIPSLPQMPYDADLINSILNASEAMRLDSFDDRASFPFWREMQASLTPIGRTDENRVYERHRQALQVYGRMAAFDSDEGAVAVSNFILALKESDALFGYVVHHIIVNGQGISDAFKQWLNEEGHVDKISLLAMELDWEYVDERFPVLNEIWYMLKGTSGEETRKRATKLADSIRTGSKFGHEEANEDLVQAVFPGNDQGKQLDWADEPDSPARTESVEVRRERGLQRRLQEQGESEAARSSDMGKKLVWMEDE